ncbi:MAG: type II secretion system protein [Thermoanaerobaculia bacterium]
MVNQRPRRRQRGFTLIELIVVVTIIGILAGIAVVGIGHAQRKAQENILKADLANMRKAIDDFYADKQRYPSSLQELVEMKYLRRIPIDPITKSAETWVPVNEEPSFEESTSMFSDDYDSAQQAGIVDVKSGAEGQTMDEPPVPYNEL